jgi:hypothetical protein
MHLPLHKSGFRGNACEVRRSTCGARQKFCCEIKEETQTEQDFAQNIRLSSRDGLHRFPENRSALFQNLATVMQIKSHQEVLQYMTQKPKLSIAIEPTDLKHRDNVVPRPNLMISVAHLAVLITVRTSPHPYLD